MSKNQRKRALQGLGVLTVLATTVAGAPAAMGAPDSPSTVNPLIEGLNGPRGLEIGPRRVFYAEADGTISKAIRQNSGVREPKVIAEVPAGFAAPVIDLGPDGQLFILTAAGEEGGGELYVREKRSREAVLVADIVAYQADDPDPYDLEENPTESNPYGLAALDDGSVLVADAAGNDLLRVEPDGDITTIARVMPRVVLMPEGIEGGPPPGTPIPAEGVTTSVTVGKDGYYYVGELRGYPATEGTSQVWRIAPDADGAVCDPESPNSGDCRRFADGFTSIVDLTPARGKGLYVLELVKESWLKWEQGTVPPIGGLYRLPARGEPVERAENELILPGAVDTADGAFVSGPILGEGAIVRIVE